MVNNELLSRKAAGCITGAVGVLERDGALLMIQRSETVRAPGFWCFPGGAIEPGETPAAAIVREFEEEVGLVVEPIGKLWEWLRDDGLLHLYWWQVRFVGGELTPNTAEVQAVRWMTDDQIRAQDGMIANNITFLDHYRSSANRNPSS